MSDKDTAINCLFGTPVKLSDGTWTCSSDYETKPAIRQGARRIVEFPANPVAPVVSASPNASNMLSSFSPLDFVKNHPYLVGAALVAALYFIFIKGGLKPAGRSVVSTTTYK